MNQHTRLRFSRRLGESFPCPNYANPIQKPERGSRLSSRTLWIAAGLVIVFGVLTA